MVWDVFAQVSHMFRNRLIQKPHVLQEGCRRRFPQESRTFPDPESRVRIRESNCAQRVRFGFQFRSGVRRPTGPVWTVGSHSDQGYHDSDGRSFDSFTSEIVFSNKRHYWWQFLDWDGSFIDISQETHRRQSTQQILKHSGCFRNLTSFETTSCATLLMFLIFLVHSWRACAPILHCRQICLRKGSWSHRI